MSGLPAVRTLAQKEREYVLGPCTAQVRREKKEFSLDAGKYVGTGEFEMVNCSVYQALDPVSLK